MQFQPSSGGEAFRFPILKSKGADGQLRIEACPDEFWTAKDYTNAEDAAQKILEKAGNLLVTAGQDPSTARLTAVSSDQKYVGVAYMPIGELSSNEAKAAAVFLNSTAGRIQFMRIAGRSPHFPIYRPLAVKEVRIPDVRKTEIRTVLLECWERTRNIGVPQFRDGECEVRRDWDQAVAEALGWDFELLSEWRHLLHREPHVRGMGYNDFDDANED